MSISQFHKMKIFYNREHLVLSTILLFSLLLRLWGLDFGLPNDRCRPDEYQIAVTALGMGSGDLNPHFFNYPTLFIYLCFFCYGLYYLIGYATGVFHQPADLGLSFLIDPTPFYLISRSLSLMAGVISVFLVYKICRRWFSQTMAVVASLLLAVAPLHVRDSHFGVTDVFMTMLVLCSIYFMLDFHHSGKQKYAVYSAVCAGLAASAKYNGGFALLPLAAVLFLHYRREHDLAGTVRQAGLALSGFALAFLCTSPFVLFDLNHFWLDFQYEMEHLQKGHLGVILDRGWIHHVRFSLFYGLGWPFLLTAASGIYFLCKRYGQKAFLLLVFPLLYYVLVGKGYTVFSRYALPLIPFMAILAAAALDQLKTRSRMTAGLVVLFITGHCLCTVAQSDRLLTQKDSRLLAAEWFLQHAPNNAAVLYCMPFWATPKLPLAHESIIHLSNHSATDKKPHLAMLYERRLAYYQKNSIPVYRQYLLENAATSELATVQPDYIVVERDNPSGSFRVATEMEAILQNSYQLQATVRAVDANKNKRHYDLQDAFYLPIAGFTGVQRPGPNLQIYQKKHD